MSNENLELWESVEKTDPRYTKDFNRGGGFKGTAISPTYNMWKATKMFGVAGIDWGWNILSDNTDIGKKLSDDEYEKCHSLLVELWFNYKGKQGKICHYGCTLFVGSNKYGSFTDEETKKKSLTDAIGKCLSVLGFSADVHLGLYDDNKYVNDRRAEVQKEDAVKLQTRQADLERRIRNHRDSLKDYDQIKAYFAEAMQQLGYGKGTAEYRTWALEFGQVANKYKPDPTVAFDNKAA